MVRVKAFVEGFLEAMLEHLVFAWRSSQPEDVLPDIDKALHVKYVNGEEEFLPLTTEIKIDMEGIVHLKGQTGRQKGRWMPYPEIVSITFSQFHFRGEYVDLKYRG